MKNALNELLPRKVRAGAYVIAGLASAAVAAWQAAEGDHLVFAAGVLTFLTSTLAAGNLTPEPEVEG